MKRIVIITGASRGIGRACALYFGRRKDCVAAVGFRHPEALSEVCEAVREAGGEACAILEDLAQPGAAERVLRACEERFGAPDILVSNAGVSAVRLFQDGTDEATGALLETNLTSAIRMARAAVKRMLPRHEGRILFVSSVFGITGASMEAEYAASKGALNALAKSLAKELAPSGIAVNALAPGAIDTDMNACLSEEDRALLEEEIPFGRMGTPEEAAEMAGLILDAPLYLTGAVIPFDGAWT
ncbi:MAG: SDR family NAD(P)-dependent oxidoreductase [Lachnospiraceae bacterium]|nr:SDR family NAD(P)-dependent oxidoreductase [Lachnospiraceae bacterium]